MTTPPSRARVVLVIRRLAGRSGGAERVYVETANMLSERGFDVTCLHFDRSRKAPFFPLRRGIKLENLWHHSRLGLGLQEFLAAAFYWYKDSKLLAPPAWFAEHFLFFLGLLRHFRSHEPDVVIALMPAAITPSLLAGALAGTRVVASNHNAPQHDYASTERWDQNPLDKAIRLPLLRRAFRVHVLFEEYRRWFPSDVQEKTVVIHNYPTDDVIPPHRDAPRDRVVLAVGRLAEVKNYGLLIDAWALLAKDFPDWQLHIYGTGPQMDVLSAQIERLDLSAVVKLCGHRPGMAEIYARASLFAHPSWYEGFPLVIIEALRSAVPVVAFQGTSGVQQLIADGENGRLVPRGDGAPAFAAALRELIADEQLRLQLGEAGPHSVAPYTKESYLNAWEQIIADACAGRELPTPH